MSETFPKSPGKGLAMTEDQERPEDFATHGAAEEVAVAERRVDAAVRSVARLIGRQMAREAFARRRAANDNRQPLKRLRD
jgi:hypothetical protein